MIRKEGENNKSEQGQCANASKRIFKTPRVVIERLNIPLDSVVLVKGNSIIFPSNSSVNEQSIERSNVTDITLSDDEIENVDFQEIMIKRFQSTHPKKGESLDLKQSEISLTARSRSVNKFYKVKKDDKRRQKMISQTDVDKKLERLPSSSSIIEKDDSNKQDDGNLLSENAPVSESEHIKELDNSLNLNTDNGVFIESSRQSNEQNESNCSDIGRKVSHEDSICEVSKNSTSDRSDNVEEILHKSDGNNSKNVSNQQSNIATKQNTSAISERNEGSLPERNLIDDDTNISGVTFSISEENIPLTSKVAQTPVSTNLSNVDFLSGSNDQIDFTPNRVSQRIKNKKVKFSALKLLAGGDIGVLKKELRKNNVNKPGSPKKSVVKTKNKNTADINANNSNLSLANAEKLTTSATAKGSTQAANDIEVIDLGDNSTRNISQKTKMSLTNQSIGATKTKQFDNAKVDSVKKSQVDGIVKEGNDKNCNISVVPLESMLSLTKTGNSPTKISENREMKKVSDKVRLQLQNNPQKKIVNITIAPTRSVQKNQDSTIKEKLSAALGPDIVIRRVKKNKNQESDDNVKEVEEISRTMTTNKEVENTKNSITSSKAEPPISTKDGATPVEVAPSNLIIKNLIYPETSTKCSTNNAEIEVPPQIKKFLLDSSKNKKTTTLKPNETLITKISAISNRKPNAKMNLLRKKKRMGELGKRKNKQKLIFEKRKEMLKSKGNTSDESAVGGETDEDVDNALDITDSQLENSENLNNSDLSETGLDNGKQNSTSKNTTVEETRKVGSFSTTVTLIGEKKTAKVTPLRQVNPRSESIKKYNNSKDLSKPKAVPKLTSSSDLCILGSKRNYTNSFEKYFICSEKMYELECLDSDSSEDTELFSHFIDLKRIGLDSKEGSNDDDNLNVQEAMNRIESMNEETVEEESDKTSAVSPGRPTSANRSSTFENGDSETVNEVVKGIAADLPRWNLHILPESSIICLILLDRETNGTLDVKKCIEIDNNFKTTVYVNKVMVNEYCGVYDSFEAIKNLIYQVDLL